MARKIYKFQIDPSGFTKITVPKNAQILTLMIDQKTGAPCLWIELNTRFELEERNFVVVATGVEFPSDRRFDYVGSFQILEGDFIGHLYEI